MNKSFGILYILFNLKTNDSGLMYEILNSIKSVKHFHPDINIIIYVEKHPDYDKSNTIPDEIKEYVKIITFSNEYKFKNDRNISWMGHNPGTGPIGINRILCMIDTPFEYTLHLDCDTIINKPLNDLIYNYKNDIYLTLDNWWIYKNSKVINELEENKHNINSGVILYKKTEHNIKLFKKVIDLIYNNNIAEQNAITSIFVINKLYSDNIKYLDNRYYNFRCENKRDLPDTDDVIICHSHGYLIHKYRF